MKILIEYTAHQDMHYEKAFKPDVYVNGKWIYTISRCKKTMRGALNEARRLAEQHATGYPKEYNEIKVQERIKKND